MEWRHRDAGSDAAMGGAQARLLRAADPQHARQADRSTGAMTNRLDRLEQAGLITRVPDPDDRRSVQVELTAAGRKAWEASVGVQAQKEELVVGALTKAERRQLNDLLRRLVSSSSASTGRSRRAVRSDREHGADVAVDLRGGKGPRRQLDRELDRSGRWPFCQRVAPPRSHGWR